MAFDFKKEYKEFYMPKAQPSIQIEEFYDYVVPPLEGFWWQDGVQCMRIGPYDDEPATADMMHRYMEEQGYTLDISDTRRHHEICLSDARRVAPQKLKTVIRHPIR